MFPLYEAGYCGPWLSRRSISRGSTDLACFHLLGQVTQVVPLHLQQRLARAFRCLRLLVKLLGFLLKLRDNLSLVPTRGGRASESASCQCGAEGSSSEKSKEACFMTFLLSGFLSRLLTPYGRKRRAVSQ